MTLNEYQAAAKKTALYPKNDQYLGLVYTTLGLANEAGEVAGKVKKLFRDDAGVLTDERKGIIEQELGDVLWYASQIATELDVDLDSVAAANLSKLASRADRGMLKGDGDSR